MTTTHSVTVIGLGPMGAATVRALLGAGHEVTVWNRTRSKVEDIAQIGATPAGSVAEAVAASEVVLVSLIDYDAMYEVLGGVPDLTGTTVVNLSSGSPGESRRGAEWVAERGGAFLTGAYMTQSDDLHHSASRLYVSGPEDLYRRLHDVLEALVPSTHYLGEDHGLAQVYYQAGLAQFHAFVTSLEQALAIVDASGADIDRFVDFATASPESNVDFLRFFADAVKQGGIADGATLRMMHAGTQHVIDAAEEVGVDAELTRTIQRYYGRAIEAGEVSGRGVSVYDLLRGEPVGTST